MTGDLDTIAANALADLIIAARERRTSPDWQRVPPPELALYELLDGLRRALNYPPDTLAGPAIAQAFTILGNAISANCPRAYRAHCGDLQAACVAGPAGGRD